MRVDESGFTIIEVTLFLAVSGLLLLMVFLGTGSLAARQRFTDTTDSLHAYIQSQYDEVVNGVNVRTLNTECNGVSNANAGTSVDCLLLGKVLSFDGSTITSQYIISTQKLTGAETSDRERLSNADLQVVLSDATTYELRWRATAYNVTRSGVPSRVALDGARVAFLRLPDSGTVMQLFYKDTPGTDTDDIRDAIQNDLGALNPAGSLQTSPPNPSLSICIKNDADFQVAGPRSAIFFDQGAGSSSIVTNYDPGVALCP